MQRSLAFLLTLLTSATIAAEPITTVEALTSAAADPKGDKIIQLAEGTFKLKQPLLLKPGTTLKGAGIGKTVLTHEAAWKANPATLPDTETDAPNFDRTGYLIHCANDGNDFTISHLTLTGPQMHGAIFGWANKRLTCHHLEIKNFMYNGIRTYILGEAKIHDCLFENVGMRWDKGQPGLKGGNTGGAIFAVWMADSEIWNCRFTDTRKLTHEHYYGIKGREARRTRIHHNTINVGFSIELPFEGDEDVEIDHNILSHAVSIPKYAGGPVPKSGRTFHIHHNYFTDSYSIEFVRNGVEIDHNLFDFDTQQDGGNLIAAFGDKPAKGPCLFHNNLVSNPGRGVIWMNEPYAQLTVRNNHIIARPTAEKRTDGLFGFNEKSDFATFNFTHNIIECQGTPRPLFRNDASAKANLTNNILTNISDTARLNNKVTDAPQGLEAPLKFTCGVNGELTVDGWKTSKTPAAK